MALFKSRGSIQIRSLPFGFTTVTMLFTQSVGSCILSMTPKCSIRCSSSFTFALMVTGIFRRGCTTGLHVGSILIWWVTLVMQPNPVKVSTYLAKGSLVTVSMCFTSCNSVIVFNCRTSLLSCVFLRSCRTAAVSFQFVGFRCAGSLSFCGVAVDLYNTSCI